MDSPTLIPFENVFWHLSVALYHLHMVVEHPNIYQILTLDEDNALTQVAHTIYDVMERLNAAAEGTAAP
jgi:hypothetical protein